MAVGARGAAPHAPCRPGAEPAGGRGGGAPRQPLPGTCGAWPRRVGWPTFKKVSQTSAEPPKPPLRASPGTALTEPSRASCSAFRSPSSRTARTTGDPRHLPDDSGALCRPSVFARPLPLGNRRSSILGDPVARRLPETPRKSRKRPLSPSRRASGPPSAPYGCSVATENGFDATPIRGQDLMSVADESTMSRGAVDRSGPACSGEARAGP